MKIQSVAAAFPQHYYSQQEISSRLAELWNGDAALLRRLPSLHENVAVQGRHLAMPLERYGSTQSFGETNDVWIETALDLGERAIGEALERAGLAPTDVDAIFFSTVTGLASPSIDARLANRLGFRPDIRRVPNAVPSVVQTS